MFAKQANFGYASLMTNKKGGLNKQQRKQKKKKRLDEPIVKATILRLCQAAPAGKSITPMDVAKDLDEERWRTYLRPIRIAASKLAREGHIEILRKGKPADPDDFKGVIRLRLKVNEEE